MNHQLRIPLAIWTTTIACSDPHAARHARPDQIPQQVAIDPGTTTSGFFTSRVRQPVDVDAFRIAKRPITVAQYKECVAAAGCSAPPKEACIVREGSGVLGRPTYDAEGGDELPVTCVGIAQAEAYCSWVGGSLPTVSQWLTAVRGREATRFAWGNRLPTCEHRPDAPPPTGLACRTPFDPSFAVGHHPASASPFGVEDVLLADGELVASSSDSPLPACSKSFAACVAYGVRPGAIDSAAPLQRPSSEEGERSPHAYAFRCAFRGDSK